MKCQACKAKNAVVEAAKHPSMTALWNAQWAKNQMKVKKERCEEHGGQ